MAPTSERCVIARWLEKRCRIDSYGRPTTPGDTLSRCVGIARPGLLRWCEVHYGGSTAEASPASASRSQPPNHRMPSIGHSAQDDNSEIVDCGDGSRLIRTAGWEWNTEDVELVLGAHEKLGPGSDQLVQRSYDLCVAQDRRIQRAVLHYVDMDAQMDSFFDALETILFEQGVLSGSKIYSAPQKG